MLDHQMIGDELYEMLSKRPLGVQAKGQISRKYPAFIQTLQADLRRQLGENKNVCTTWCENFLYHGFKTTGTS